MTNRFQRIDKEAEVCHRRVRILRSQ
jgi:hypothetical protein